MATTFTYTAPLIAPSGLTVTRIPNGGGWSGFGSSATYRFVVQVLKNGINSLQSACSPVSEVFELEVFQDDALIFDFTNNDPSADSYEISMEKIQQSGIWTWVSVASYTFSAYPTPRTLTSPRHYWYNYVSNAYHFYPYQPFGFDTSLGWFNLEITGDGDGITCEDINGWIRTNHPELEGSYWQDFGDYGLSMNGTIYAEDYTNGEMFWFDKTINMIRPIRTGDGLRVRAEGTTMTSIILFQNAQTMPSFRWFSITLCVLKGDERLGTSSAVIWLQETGYGWQSGTISGSQIFVDIYSMDYENIFGAGNETKIFGLYLNGNIYKLTQQASVRNKYADALIQECTFIVVSWSGYMFLQISNTDFVNEYRDCKFITLDTGWGYVPGDEVPLSQFFWTYSLSVYSYANTSGTGYFYFSNTVTLNFKDINGNDLSGVSVVITDVDSNVAYSDTVDITEDVVLDHLFIKPNELPTPAGYGQIGVHDENHNPFTFTISKGGYQTTTLTKEILEKQELDVTLLEVPPEPLQLKRVNLSK